MCLIAEEDDDDESLARRKKLFFWSISFFTLLGRFISYKNKNRRKLQGSVDGKNTHARTNKSRIDERDTLCINREFEREREREISDDHFIDELFPRMRARRSRKAALLFRGDARQSQMSFTDAVRRSVRRKFRQKQVLNIREENLFAHRSPMNEMFPVRSIVKSMHHLSLDVRRR